MHRLLFLALAIPLAVMAQAPPPPPAPAVQAPAAPAPAVQAPASPSLPGTCVITGNSLVTDMRDNNCFPKFDKAKCSYSANMPLAETTGASDADVEDTRKHGQAIMKYAQTQVCEGRNNCGFYVLQFASEAKCDGKPQADMPGGEYRGLTSAAVRNIQKNANRNGESASANGKSRGDNAKNPKDKGKLWGANK